MYESCMFMFLLLQCAANGLTYDRLAQEGLSCVRLEMFFGGYCQLAGLSFFPNLQVLCIMGQTQLTSIHGLAAVPKLKELWICECQLQVVSSFAVHYFCHLE